MAIFRPPSPTIRPTVSPTTRTGSNLIGSIANAMRALPTRTGRRFLRGGGGRGGTRLP